MGLNVVTDAIGGLFGGGDDNSSNQTNASLDAQIAMNQQELENKRQNLYKQRLDIIKSIGGQNWTGARNTDSGVAPQKPNIPPWFPGFPNLR